jgi:hypothetical protein
MAGDNIDSNKDKIIVVTKEEKIKRNKDIDWEQVYAKL